MNLEQNATPIEIIEFSNRGHQLHFALNRLLQGVTIPDGLGEGMQEFEEGNFATLREVLATFLVQDTINPDNVQTSWDVVSPHLNFALEPAKQEKLKGVMSQALTGTPSHVLETLDYQRQDSFLKVVHNTYRQQMTPLQHRLIPIVVGRAI